MPVKWTRSTKRLLAGSGLVTIGILTIIFPALLSVDLELLSALGIAAIGGGMTTTGIDQIKQGLDEAKEEDLEDEHRHREGGGGSRDQGTGKDL